MAREIEVEKSILIDKPKQAVYNYLKLTRNQENFSTWNMADPGKQTSSEGIDGTVGFIYSWDSKDKNVGAGSQEITGLVEGDCIEYALRFERPMKNIATSKFILEAVGDNQTKVTWDFRGPTSFWMGLFKGIVQKMLGKSLAQSLATLKQVLEQ